jgi:hypothetical protein
MKRSGLVADLEMVGARSSGPAVGDVRAHLFGPLEVFGPRTRHGDRFAHAILQLLRWLPDLSGMARVLINEREYVLHLDHAGVAIQAAVDDEGADEVTEPEGPDATEALQTAVVAGVTGDETFDSEVEARLFATLRGMEQRGDTRGWHVEREPEPLIEGGVVVVPDFALTRVDGEGTPIKVFVEVIGFWTPAYRERKRQKLAALPPSLPLVLAIQEQLAGDFKGLPFPVLSYRQRVSAADLIGLLRRAYGGQRVSAEHVKETLTTLVDACRTETGIVREESVAQAIGLGAADDLGAVVREQAVRNVLAKRGWQWVPGLGLCHADWLAGVEAVCDRVIAASGDGSAALDTVAGALRGAEGCRGHEAANHLDALLPRVGFEVVWETLFEATVRRKPEV